MADLIDREKLLNDIFNLNFKNVTEMFEFIAKTPSVDAVEVVRCKDCKHRNREYICKIHYLKVIKEFYCASGVKKNEIN